MRTCRQDFSARAGAVAATQKLAGTRLDVPTSAAVLATKGACGDLGAFAFDGALLAAAKVPRKELARLEMF